MPRSPTPWMMSESLTSTSPALLLSLTVTYPSGETPK